jgi:predicted dehydrogenase
VFVEKPLAGSTLEARMILETAEARGLKVMVGHTFVYTGAVREMRSLVESGSLGSLRYFDSCRVNLGLVQHDVDVTWDLAVHDLAIVHYVTGLEPRAVSAVGVAHAPSHMISTAFLTLVYDNEFVAHIDVNWMSPVKIRRTLLGGDRRMVVWDDLEPSEKLRVYDSGVDPVVDGDERMSRLVQYRVGDMVAPRLDATEALALEFADFAAWLRGGSDPPNAGEAGLSVVRALEAAGKSMALGGTPVEITRGTES